MPDRITDDPLFDAFRSSLYHEDRAAFLDRANKLMTFLIIVLGATAAFNVVGVLRLDHRAADFLVVVIASLQHVFRPGERATNHKWLHKNYKEFLRELQLEDAAIDEVCTKFSAKLITMSVEEDIQMRAAMALGYNETLDMLVDDPELRASRRLRVRWYHVMFRHFFSFKGTDFSPPEREPRA